MSMKEKTNQTNSALLVPYIPFSAQEEMDIVASANEGPQQQVQPPSTQKNTTQEPSNQEPDSTTNENVTIEEIEERKERFANHFFSMSEEFKREALALEETEIEILASTSQYVDNLTKSLGKWGVGQHASSPSSSVLKHASKSNVNQNKRVRFSDPVDNSDDVE